MSAVMIVFKKPSDWATVKKELAAPDFTKKIKEFDMDSVDPATLKKIEGFTKRQEFNHTDVGKVSMAAGALCLWVRSLEDYTKALKIVEPKRKRKAYAEEQLRRKEQELQELKDDFEKLQMKLRSLTEQF